MTEITYTEHLLQLGRDVVREICVQTDRQTDRETDRFARHSRSELSLRMAFAKTDGKYVAPRVWLQVKCLQCCILYIRGE